MTSITDHPMYRESFERWLAVFKATTDPASAEVRAHQAAVEYVSRRTESRFYEGRKHIGPDARAEG